MLVALLIGAAWIFTAEEPHSECGCTKGAHSRGGSVAGWATAHRPTVRSRCGGLGTDRAWAWARRTRSPDPGASGWNTR